MEESSSTSRTTGSGPREETNDWKTKFTPDVRRQVVNKILSSLKMCSSNPDARTQVAKVVEQFEENTFRNARTKDDYICTITRRLSLVGQKSVHCTAGVSSSNPGKLPQNTLVAGDGQSISLKNVCQASSEFAGDSFRQGMQSNISVNNQNDISGTQTLQKVVNEQHQQQDSQQFLKYKLHQPNIGTSRVRDNNNNHHHQQQQHILSQSSLFCSLNQALPKESWQPPFTEQSGASVFQPNHIVAQEYNQQLSPFWKSITNSFQPVGLQSNGSCLQQQHGMVGPQLKAGNLKSPERSVHTFQVEDTSSQAKLGQRVQSVNKFHHLLDSPNQRTHEATPRRPVTMSSLLIPQSVNDQQKVLSSQKSLPEFSSASLESASSSEQANMAELHEQAYQKFQSLKEEYLPLLTYFYNILKEKCQKLPMPEVVGNYRKRITVAEKLIKVLSTPQAELVRLSMKKLESFQQTVKQFLNSFKWENLVSVQPPGGPSRTSQLQRHTYGECQFHPVNLALTSKPVGPSPLSSTQQVVHSSQPNIMNSPCSGSPSELEQHNAPSSLDYAARPEGLDIAGAQQNTFSHDTRVKSFNSATKSLQQNYIMNTSHQQKQHKHQMTQPQNIKQHIQPKLIQQHMRIANAQPFTASGVLQKNPLISQSLEYSHQMPLSMTPRHFQSTSPQMSQHSSAQVDQQNFSLPLSKAGTPLHSTSSSLIIYSPYAPYTPFSRPADYKKHPSGSSPLLIRENSGHPQPIFALTAVDTKNEVPTQSLPVALPGIEASLLCTESASPNGNQQSSATENPLERLIKAVQSLSPKALSAAVSEIGSVMEIVDGIDGTACVDSEAVADENLHGRSVRSLYVCSFEDKMKRKLDNTSAMTTDALSFPLSETDNIKQSTCQIRDLESSETFRIKRRRIEPSHALLDEIKYINKRLVQTVLDLDSTEDIVAFDHGEGTIVRCIHNAVALSENFKMQYASQMSVLQLRLLVPVSYPITSPVIVGGFTFDWSESKGSIDLSEETRSRFSLSLRKLSEPMSLAEIAMAWDDCTRTVLLECAESVGGGSFSSRYGKWENCLTA